ncbi:MAG: hypothetical protein NZT61_00920 [Deltaproteobacteria bacterium]|nr:hypothetical protein [Deltaproteobacteria bacterium]MCX7952106.1 hypothetical protein [Deltaproteobacteria bacterium]
MKKNIPFKEILKIELEGWCYGISNYPGEIHAGLIHRIIQELQGTICRAMEEDVEIDFVKLGTKIAQASRYMVDEREVTFSLLCQLPNPNYLDGKEQQYVRRAIQKACETFPEIEQMMELKWKFDEEAVE